MKILFIIESLKSGGKERRLASLMEGLINYYSVKIFLIVLNKDIHYKEIFQNEIDIFYFERDIRRDLFILNKFSRVLNYINPDIVHCWDNISAIHFGPICKIRNIPFINSMITTAPPRLSIFSKRYFFNAISYPFSDIILTNSKAGLNSYRVSDKKGEYIYNGFDMNRTKVKIPKDEIRSKFKIKSDYVVGMVASFSNMKDYDTFVEAGKSVLEKGYSVTFICVGDGENLERIKNKTVEYNENFIFTGKQKDVESIVNIFDIGVLSTYTEGISNSIMEYMALAKPVIATIGGGTSELVINNETGILINQKDYKTLSKKIIYLINRPNERKRLGENGKKRILGEFSFEKMVSRTYDLYVSILNK